MHEIYGPMQDVGGAGPDPDYPAEDDATLCPTGPLGGKTALSFGQRYVGTFSDEAAAEACLARVMAAEKFWPDVWQISDHGNACLISARFYQEHDTGR